MNEMEIALNGAIFAVAKMVDKGSTAYAVKDRNGSWHQMEWSVVTSKLYKLLTLKEYKNENTCLKGCTKPCTKSCPVFKNGEV